LIVYDFLIRHTTVRSSGRTLYLPKTFALTCSKLYDAIFRSHLTLCLKTDTQPCGCVHGLSFKALLLSSLCSFQCSLKACISLLRFLASSVKRSSPFCYLRASSHFDAVAYQFYLLRLLREM